MIQRIVSSSLLAVALISGLLMWIEHPAQAASAYAPRTTRCVNPGGTSGCGTSIQTAISASSYGDLVDVWAGTYNEHLVMLNGVSVHGAGWSSSIINGGYNGQTVVTFGPGIDATTVLSGVQVTGGGTGDPTTSFSAGGIAIDSSPQIINTWVYSNTGSSGGGVYVSGNGSPIFNNVPAWNNRAATNGGGFSFLGNGTITLLGDFSGFNGTVYLNSAGAGGGIYAQGNMTLTIFGLRIAGNTATTSSGGGVHLAQNANPVLFSLNNISGNNSQVNGGGLYAYQVDNLQLLGNFIGDSVSGGNYTASLGGGAYLNSSAGSFQLNFVKYNGATDGGGVYAQSNTSALTFSGNLFEGNLASSYGGGLHLTTNSVALLDANTIVSNTAYNNGGGIYSSSPNVTFTNNIVARNVISYTGGGGIALNSPARIVNNTVANNTGDGIYANGADGSLVANNISHENTGYGINITSTTTFTADYNDVYGNSYSGSWPRPHDLAVYADFISTGDMTNFYHLLATSPVSRTGSIAFSPPRDIDNQVRLVFTSMGADQMPSQYLFLPLIKR